MSGGATKEGTRAYAEKFRGVAGDGHFREAQDLVVSSLGIGTYLGQPNDDKDAGYTAAIIAAVQAGINVIDTAINYRFQRSERNVGAALKVLATGSPLLAVPIADLRFIRDLDAENVA